MEDHMAIHTIHTREVDQVVISPPLSEPSTNAWATRQYLGFSEWRADLNGWVVHGGDVPIEWNKPKKVRRKRASVEKPKTGNPKPPAVTQFGFGATPVTKSSVPAAASTRTLSPLKQYRRKTSASRVKVPESLEEFGDNKETQSEDYDFEDTATDFGKLLFLASVSSHVSFPDFLYSLGPTDEDIKIVDEGHDVIATAKETAARMPSQENASKDPDITLTAGKLLLECPAKGMLLLRLPMMFTKAKNL
nr:hypothetical protein CFP56_27476 [Quercus suber]